MTSHLVVKPMLLVNNLSSGYLMLEAVVRMKELGMAVLLVEQNVKKAMEVADRVYALQSGKIVLSGTAEECQRSDLIRKAYLGM